MEEYITTNISERLNGRTAQTEFVLTNSEHYT